MNQPNFRKHLTLLAFWAKACKAHLEYQAKHGKPPPSPDEARADIFKAAGFEVAPPPNPYFKLLAKWKKTGKASPFDFVFDHSSDPFYQLFFFAQKVLEYPESHWPPMGGSIRDLLAILCPIEKQGGRSATLVDLERIRELVAVLLGGEPIEAKEPRSSWQCPNGNIKVPERLKEPLEAYLAGLPDYDLKDHHQPRKVKTDLKKLIQKACDAGYQPDPDRWPRSEGQDGGGMMLYFDAQEDGNRRNQGKRKKA